MNTRPHSTECETGEPCHSCYQKAWYRKTLKGQRASKMQNPEYRESYLARQREHSRRYYRDPIKRAKQVEATARWMESNREHFAAYSAKWTKDNAPTSRAKCARRRSAKRNAVPAWASHEELRSVYANCPAGMEVDHIVPLQGKAVCGLHVPWNLQYLTPAENRSKGNKLER